MDSKERKLAEIILEEENHRFSLDKSLPAAGHVILKADGGSIEVMLQASNLRMLDRNRYTYRLLALGLKDGHSLHRAIGDFEAGTGGSAEGQWQLAESDFDGIGNGIENFYIFMITAVSLENPQEPYHPVMKGDWDRTWRIDKSFNNYYSDFVRGMAAKLISGRDAWEKIDLFEEKWIADNWRCVRTSENGISAAEAACMFPVASADAMDRIIENGHFVFAFNDEYLLLGIPGTHKKEQQPEGGASGFTIWQPAGVSAIHGYWLTAIHRETGEIVGI